MGRPRAARARGTSGARMRALRNGGCRCACGDTPRAVCAHNVTLAQCASGVADMLWRGTLTPILYKGFWASKCPFDLRFHTQTASVKFPFHARNVSCFCRFDTRPKPSRNPWVRHCFQGPNGSAGGSMSKAPERSQDDRMAPSGYEALGDGSARTLFGPKTPAPCSSR